MAHVPSQWDSGKQSGGNRRRIGRRVNRVREFLRRWCFRRTRASVTLGAATPHHGRHVPRGGAEGAPDVQRVVRRPGHRVRQRGTSRVARVPRRHAPPPARWPFVGGFSSAMAFRRRRPRSPLRSPPSSPSTPSSPRAQALEIRAFVDGSSANQNRYHYAVRDVSPREHGVVVPVLVRGGAVHERANLQRLGAR